MLKSLMKSYYKSGNVKFYDNLHKKYFDKAKNENKQEHDAFELMMDKQTKHKGTTSPLEVTNDHSILTLSRSRSRSKGRASKYEHEKNIMSKFNPD